jgi:hypothetical protein
MSVDQLSKYLSTISVQDLRTERLLDQFISHFPVHPVQALPATMVNQDVSEAISHHIGIEYISPPSVPDAAALNKLVVTRIKIKTLKLAEEIGVQVAQLAASGEEMLSTPLKKFDSFDHRIAPSTFFSRDDGYSWLGDEAWCYPVPELEKNANLSLLRQIFEEKGFMVDLKLTDQGWFGGWDGEYAPIMDPDDPHEGQRELPICISLRWADAA